MLTQDTQDPEISKFWQKRRIGLVPGFLNFKPTWTPFTVSRPRSDGSVAYFHYAWKNGPALRPDGCVELRGKWRDMEVEIDRVFSITMRRAKTRGQEFTLTTYWVQHEILRHEACCALTRLPFDFWQTKSDYTKNPNKPSIDRIDNSKGYTPDNCRVVLSSVNLALNEWGEENLVRIAEALIARRPKSRGRKSKWPHKAMEIMNPPNLNHGKERE